MLDGWVVSQPGGTCTAVLGQWATRMVGKEEDPEGLGRWSTLRIKIKGTVISMITAYRVCKTRVNLDINTAYSQQWKEMTTRTCKNINIRAKTLMDLKNK